MSLVKKVPCVDYRTDDTVYRRYAHYKLDGSFACIRRTPVSFGIYSSRGNNSAHKLGWHPAYSLWASIEPGTSILGELWVPGRPASYVTTAIVEHDPALRFMPFAIDMWQSRSSYDDVELLQLSLPELYARLAAIGFSDEYRIPWVPLAGLEGTRALHRELVANNQPEFLGHRIEGYVFKNGNLADFAKDKPEPTIDLIVTGYAFGDEEKANADMVRRLICSTVEGYEVCVASGMTQEASAEMTAQRDTLVGRVVEIRYNDVLSKGRLRHPRFVRFRDDKFAIDCKVDQSFDLKQYWCGKHQLTMFPEGLPQ